ncbi:DUF5333 domain-containing protein [Roseovarius sp. LXJ103]|uniref:DUF5333 domain-containing protein n=1 Tax=Roseovarius carneus TaxID=2853164 RepID=UPI000D60D81C|nr:DUF5333 domain-containing protein [Roseovarius carneus]MBZ8119638.1 DUF5333 domain-containing protein [Roseovarius carneus]PWE34747.1 hypothetical protein DD563_01355 [Pelagicola sp. LXJ1103]
MRKMTTLALVATLAGGLGGPAAAGLDEEADINAGLMAVAAADKIRRECSAISGRLWVARSYTRALADMAKDRGYSQAEIDAYVNDRAEKAKMRERRNAYFKSKGASNLDPESLCTLGRAEIAGQTQIGSFLKAK